MATRHEGRQDATGGDTRSGTACHAGAARPGRARRPGGARLHRIVHPRRGARSHGRLRRPRHRRPRDHRHHRRGRRPVVPRPVAPQGTVLYAVSETEEVRSPRSTPPPGRYPPAVRARPLGRLRPHHLACASGHVVTAHYGSGSVSALSVRPGGSLRGVSGLVQHEGRAPGPERQAGPTRTRSCRRPEGACRWRWTSVPTPSASTPSHPATGALTPRGGTSLRPGSGPRHLAFHPAGRHVYVLAELTPTLTVCRWNPRGGTLVPVGRCRYGPAPGERRGLPVRRGRRPRRQVRLGGGARRRHPRSSPWTATANGSPPWPTCPAAAAGPGTSPSDPGAVALYVANERSGDVTWFDIDPATGVPVPGRPGLRAGGDLRGSR